jgi:hypothetical protein
MGYLALLGFALAFVVFTAALQGEPPKQAAKRHSGSGFEVAMAVGFLGLLLGVGIVVAISRRDFWRIPKSPVLDFLFSLGLIILSTAGVFGLCWATCSAAGVN